ncbi:GNAT family N-acetyltransferase [Blastococcus sp. SYSU D00922]
MRHDHVVDGYAFRLRPVEVTDAATIAELRGDAELSRFLHATDASVAAQVRWLDAYFERPDDFYWAVERRAGGAVEGFVGVYDVSAGTAEWGRWVLRRGSLAAAESAWLVHVAAFGRLGLDAVRSRTLADNRSVVAFHERYGAEVTGVLPAHTTIGGVPHDAVEAVTTRQRWETTAEPHLRAAAQRAARLVQRTNA